MGKTKRKRNTTEITRRLEITLKDEKKKNPILFIDWFMLIFMVAINYIMLYKYYTCGRGNWSNEMLTGWLAIILIATAITYFAFTRIFDRRQK